MIHSVWGIGNNGYKPNTSGIHVAALYMKISRLANGSSFHGHNLIYSVVDVVMSMINGDMRLFIERAAPEWPNDNSKPVLMVYM